MEYPEALKKVQAAKPKENYMLISLSYDNSIVLPYKEGILFMQSLVNAERLTKEYSKPCRIEGFNRDTFEVHVLPHSEYQRYKIATLMGIDPDEVKAFEKQPTDT